MALVLLQNVARKQSVVHSLYCEAMQGDRGDVQCFILRRKTIRCDLKTLNSATISYCGGCMIVIERTTQARRGPQE